MAFRTFVLLSFALCVACGDDDGSGGDTNPMDANPVDTAPDVSTDVFADTSMEMSTFFGPCYNDSQCPDNGICRRPYLNAPNGFCTKTCAERRECTSMDSAGNMRYNWCRDVEGIGRICEQRCVNSTDCGREDYICGDIGAEEFGGVQQVSAGVCRGYCRRDSDCGLGAECNEQSGECVPVGQDTNIGGRANDPCESDSDCQSGSCIEEEIDGTGTGEIGGRCTGVCAVPFGYNSSNFYLGDSLPTNACASNGDVCVPAGNQLTQGSEGSCLSECVNDSDCREGRMCLRNIGGKRFDNGVCVTANCQMNGVDCPSGYSCETRSIQGGRSRGVCVAN